MTTEDKKMEEKEKQMSLSDNSDESVRNSEGNDTNLQGNTSENNGADQQNDGNEQKGERSIDEGNDRDGYSGRRRSVNGRETAQGADGGRRRMSTFNRSKRRSRERPKSEFDSRVLSARRVSRVVAGGRRFSLSVAVAVGNGKGKVGIGTGKGPDMATAMEKARNQAQKRLIEIQTTKEKGIPSEAIGKYCASVVQVRPANGFVAGGAVRTIAELAGIQYINAKIRSRSKSHLNNARAAMRAFEAMCSK